MRQDVHKKSAIVAVVPVAALMVRLGAIAGGGAADPAADGQFYAQPSVADQRCDRLSDRPSSVIEFRSAVPVRIHDIRPQISEGHP